MLCKKVLCRERLRRVPEHFSWVDHRLVRDEHIRRVGSEALALYLLLVTVGDADGLSYYAEGTSARLLSLSAAEVAQAREQLVQAGLIAYERPIYQVLALDSEALHDDI
jgi:hypothetical protein